MMTFKRIAAITALGASTLAPGLASAQLSGNAGVMSQYLFRGLAQSDGASVYGGLDYAHDSGFYVGTWAATVNFGGTPNLGDAGSTGAEVDVYAGFSGGDAITYDIGAIYYWYSEEDELDQPDPSYNTIELYGSLGFGPVSLSGYFAPDTYFGADDSAYGVYASGSFPLTDILAFDAAVGLNGGKGNEAFTPDGDSYIEYNLGVSAGLENGFGFGFSFVATDIEDDDPKLIVDASYSFDLM